MNGFAEHPAASASLEPGDLLDAKNYRIVRLLGRGGMGSVYEAEQVRTHKRVAIKAIHPKHAHNLAAAERLVREAQATARVPHPNVVDVYHVITEGQSVYLVMEYLEGETLGQYLVHNSLAPHRIIALILPAMRAVATAHRQGVIHRDLKPANIFLANLPDTPEPVAKVLDFGISKLEARESELQSLTGSGHILGTPAYMSFEQLSGRSDIDARADVYAFGVILYEALTGRLPYQAQTLTELVYKITTTSPPTIKSLRPELPQVLDAIVSWAMDKEREQRISSLDSLIHELEPLATATGYASQLTDTSLELEAPAVLNRLRRALPVPRRKPHAIRARWLSLTALLLGAAAFVSLNKPIERTQQPPSSAQAVDPGEDLAAASSAIPLPTEPMQPVKEVVVESSPPKPSPVVSATRGRERVAVKPSKPRASSSALAGANAQPSKPSPPLATPQPDEPIGKRTAEPATGDDPRPFRVKNLPSIDQF